MLITIHGLDGMRSTSLSRWDGIRNGERLGDAYLRGVEDEVTMFVLDKLSCVMRWQGMCVCFGSLGVWRASFTVTASEGGRPAVWYLAVDMVSLGI
jgi:hypothetical protein